MDFGNRKPIVTILAMAFAVTSLVFLVAGVWYNPSVQGFFSPKLQVKTVVGVMETFDLPSQISFLGMATEWFGEASCNLTSDAFDIGNPILVSVNVNLPPAMENKLYFIDVKIDNAIMYESFLGTNSIPYPSDITMFPINGSTRGSGDETVIFETIGTLSMTIKIAYEYPLGSSNTLAEYMANATFPNLQIGTGQEIQQQRNEDVNLSLTFFVLFFACVDIAVVFYDHSEKNEEKPETEDKAKQSKNEIQTHNGNGK